MNTRIIVGRTLHHGMGRSCDIILEVAWRCTIGLASGFIEEGRARGQLHEDSACVGTVIAF